jgi:hypothetical protein
MQLPDEAERPADVEGLAPTRRDPARAAPEVDLVDSLGSKNDLLAARQVDAEEQQYVDGHQIAGGMELPCAGPSSPIRSCPRFQGGR